MGEEGYVLEAGHGEGLQVVTRRVHCCVSEFICQKAVVCERRIDVPEF